MSVRDGERLAALIDADRWNRAFLGGPVVVPPTGPLPRVELARGAVLTVLSPTGVQLRALRTLWNRESRQAGFAPGSLKKGDVKLGREAIESAEDLAEDVSPIDGRGSPERSDEDEEATGRSEDVDLPDLEALAEAPLREDRAVANGSSIALLAEVGGRSLLIGGDAHVRVLEHSIGRLLRERGQDRLHVDLFVVPHSGSRSSVSKELLALVACDRYLITTNGATFRHPHPEAVARIIVHGRTDIAAGPTLIFNYRTPRNARWADSRLQARYRYRAIYPTEDQAGIRVKL